MGTGVLTHGAHVPPAGSTAPGLGCHTDGGRAAYLLVHQDGEVRLSRSGEAAVLMRFAMPSSAHISTWFVALERLYCIYSLDGRAAVAVAPLDGCGAPCDAARSELALDMPIDDTGSELQLHEGARVVRLPVPCCVCVSSQAFYVGDSSLERRAFLDASTLSAPPLVDLGEAVAHVLTSHGEGGDAAVVTTYLIASGAVRNRWRSSGSMLAALLAGGDEGGEAAVATCPPTLVWQSCGSACTPTCADPVPRCGRSCVARCGCPFGLVLETGRCLLPATCNAAGDVSGQREGQSEEQRASGGRSGRSLGANVAVCGGVGGLAALLAALAARVARRPPARGEDGKRDSEAHTSSSREGVVSLGLQAPASDRAVPIPLQAPGRGSDRAAPSARLSAGAGVGLPKRPPPPADSVAVDGGGRPSQTQRYHTRVTRALHGNRAARTVVSASRRSAAPPLPAEFHAQAHLAAEPPHLAIAKCSAGSERRVSSDGADLV